MQCKERHATQHKAAIADTPYPFAPDMIGQVAERDLAGATLTIEPPARTHDETEAGRPITIGQVVRVSTPVVFMVLTS